MGVIGAFGPLVELEDLGDPAFCDPRRWTPAKFQCMPADTLPMGSFCVPVALQPWLSLVRDEGASTGEAMGAISAAFLVPPR